MPVSMAGIVKLERHPLRHPDCCLSLSEVLLDALTIILSRNINDASDRLVLSIGSGSGLLEALLCEKWCASDEQGLFIEGVEVQQINATRTLNKFLPEQHHSFVKGTWDLTNRAAEAAALMFVYPRSPDLVTRYLNECTHPKDAKLDTVIWLGPKCDWSEFERCFTKLDDWSLQVVPDEHSGLLEYEMLAVIKKR